LYWRSRPPPGIEAGFNFIASGPDGGILGVVDGFSPKGVEDDTYIKWRKDFLRQIGYKQ